jgi:hypothetical protein
MRTLLRERNDRHGGVTREGRRVVRVRFRDAPRAKRRARR